MRAVDIIIKKRAGGELSRHELQFLIGGYVAGDIPAYQVSAWAMAVFFQGMSQSETATLTRIMLESGVRMNLAGIPGPFVDKHSTGGVGDKTSLILAPLLASRGIKVPMMSGRALGHTGGTLDKLESIPGYRTALNQEQFRTILARNGFAMTGQTQDTVPADRLLYALRDVTGTVESIPLITASILAKKAAEGAEALVMDVKYGSGAFMKEKSAAQHLAASLVKTGSELGMRVVALLTDMDQPLGFMTGNFLEIEETLDCLEGKGPPDLMEITLALAASMAVLGGQAQDIAAGRLLCAQALASGKPRQLFLNNIAAQGGDPDQLLSLRGTYRSPAQEQIQAVRGGFIARIDAGKVGHAGILLGIGRSSTEDTVCPTAGVQFHKKAGDPVSGGEGIMTVWAKDSASLEAARGQLRDAVEYSDSAPAPRTLIADSIGMPLP
ncbi:MAG: thymidine phosphorylase [Spirochaetaceae bacterium]|jgi:pyrimidine-nucleoside phosphorylase|nr:thymidine phosphorylase [Spirochaetaceae bacterium]